MEEVDAILEQWLQEMDTDKREKLAQNFEVLEGLIRSIQEPLFDELDIWTIEEFILFWEERIERLPMLPEDLIDELRIRSQELKEAKNNET